ncbi:hypothetical protein CVN56_26065 [Rhodococcus sp. AQ5-07]|nr:hypothetical protein CVN56_26065 [Rhodococcus sp. AQ5-07]
MLVTHFEDHDTVGQWMAHHLAQLIVAAQDDTSTTVEQRLRIVETILAVWAKRRSYPARRPLEEYTNVFEALDRLGDDNPWKFSRLFNSETEVPEASALGLPLVVTAINLERLTRQTLLRLIWIEAQKAKEEHEDWLKVADKVASNIESDVTAIIRRRLRKVERQQRLRATKENPPDTSEMPDGNPDDALEEGPVLTEDFETVDIMDSEPAHDDDLFDEDDDDDDPLSDSNHAKHLRAMADLLNKIADELPGSDSAKEDDGPSRTS